MSSIRIIVRRLAHSLSTRLLVIFLLASIAYGYATRLGFTLFQDTDYLRRIAGAHVALHTEYIIEDIGSPPDLARAQDIVDIIPVDIRIIGPDVDWSSTADFYPLEAIPFAKATWLDLAADTQSKLEVWVKTLEKVEFARFKEHTLVKIRNEDYDIIFASPRISEIAPQNYTSWIFGIIGVVVLFFCYLAVRWVFQPIRWMQEGAARIGQGELDYRIPTPRRDELGDLTRDINNMANDVQDMLEAKRQLMLAISHELRSPLTRSKVALELVEDGKARATIQEDIEEMERLISDLLESEALNTRHAVIRREPVDMSTLLDSVLEIDFSGRNDGISVDVEDELPKVELDATRIRLLLRNLIDNGLRYNPEDGEPLKIKVSKPGKFIRIVVQDYGQGISAEHIKHVTEAFYRADPARSRATGGVGLGLYLCKRIVEVHGGTMDIDSTPGSGTRVTVDLPA
ncbi:MAG: HAMP domain-containing sensor histidine kinase [Gammaproteobacteria bacterium]|jgi:signal transduction histidine kinase|nr:HAMP domain-containing sensor histidine kinase [Gammaproteobacteria bacterium]MDP6616413.1 HAMP domain-containing sensor histidine kinase [Gammaproteobacteria bacterium]MDP6695743.1 HAMP domain-containing sensor histidine kinase [Gammaproteobacteria bacterium]